MRDRPEGALRRNPDTPVRDRGEWHLLDWLSKEDSSAYGECKGVDFNNIEGEGLAKVIHKDARGRDYDRVALTEAGWAEIRRLGPWSPVP